MTKRLFSFLVLVVFFSTVFAQNELPSIPLNDDGKPEFNEVVNVDLKKEQLYSNAKVWVTKTFNSYKGVVKLEDNENYKLVIESYNSFQAVEELMSEKLKFTLIIECKDGRYRYKVNEIRIIQSLLGIELPSLPICFHQNSANIAKEKLKDLEAIDVSNLKRRKRKEHEEKKASLQQEYTSEKRIYLEEYYTLTSITKSLKKQMKINDDF